MPLPTMTPQEFVQKWRNIDAKERSIYQTHFSDLCYLVGHLVPYADPSTADDFCYEASATKQGGKQGWADVWKRGYFAIEYKGKHANLEKAYNQLLLYRESLDNPPLLIVTDTERIIIHTNFTNTVKQVITLGLDELLTTKGQQQLHDIFHNPFAFKAPTTTEQVTQKAAAEFAELAKLLQRYHQDRTPHEIAHFLIRLLFCLFAEDVGLLPAGLFSRLVKQTQRKASAFSAQLRQLFSVMATGGFFGSDEIRHFNGRLFDDDTVIDLDSDSLDILLKVSRMDWSSIEPSVLGTLFERSLDPGKRAQLGAHYTSRDDILLIVEPVLMQPLRRRWAVVEAEARQLASERDAAEGRTRTQRQQQLIALLQGFTQELEATTVLDPACGSGNFLYVALKQLLDLEKAVITLGQDLGLPATFPQVSPEQLHGIELNEYAHELAQITVWIGYIQWMKDNGFGNLSDPILKPLDTIRNMDAILSIDEDGNAYAPEWPETTVIIGNPPFLGDKKMRRELGDTYTEQVRQLYKKDLPGSVDLVTYWFNKAIKLIAQNTKRAGFITTNSIRKGDNQIILNTIIKKGNIFFAWGDRPWVLDGADVRVSIIGFDNGSESLSVLDGQQVAYINSDLSSNVNTTQALKLLENKGLSYLGMMKAGPFDISNTVAQLMLQAPINPNGRPNSDVVKSRIGGQDIVKRSTDKWIIDFGVSMSEEDASFYEIPFEYILKYVKPIRDTNRRKSMKQRWWLLGETRPGLRKAIKGLRRMIVTPEVSKYRIFVWKSEDIIPDHTCHVIARNDDYFFGLLHSKSHELWSLLVGNNMGVGNDPRYNSSRIVGTFPFPWAPGHEPLDDPRVEAIAQAARELVGKRDNWLNPADASEAELKQRTLTNLYNQRPTWLDIAHQQLDRAVFAAYDWPDDLSDTDILERLLALNLERAAAQAH